MIFQLNEAEAKLEEVQFNLQEESRKKDDAEDRARKYEDLSNTLQETLKIFESIPKFDENTEEDKEKLKEAEAKIAYLNVLSE